MTSDRERILSQFIDAWNAGERPDVDAFVARAPEGEREELVADLAAFLTWAPTPDYDAATAAAIAEEPAVRAARGAAGAPGGLWPALLPRLRGRAGLSVADVAAGLVARLRPRSGGAAKVAAYLERMERGELEPTGVSRRLLGALAGVLGVPEHELEGAGEPGSWRAAAPVFRARPGSAESVREDLEVLADILAAPGGADWDEVDELFRGGR